MTDGGVADGFDIVPVLWEHGSLRLLDQRRLPAEEVWIPIADVPAAIAAIRDLAVRGAPAIGITGAFALAVAALGTDDPRAAVEEAAPAVREARPTAVNLAWAVGEVLTAMGKLAADAEPESVRRCVVDTACRIAAEDHAACRAIGRAGETLIGDGAGILTHCNAGALATGGYGTALGVVRGAVEAGKRIHVWVDETRPVLQGARLTAWELTRAGIPNTLIVDGAAPSLMRAGAVDVAIVGADRIAANGDVVNKIGTYGVALAAAAHGVPFVVAAPLSTVDLECATGDDVPIEERPRAEVIEPSAAQGQPVANPAFDVTPAELVTAIVTEVGILRAPYSESLRAAHGGRVS